MTPEEIRAEAVERLAQAMAALECPGPPGERHHATAEVMVDALGDLLPTIRESRFLKTLNDGRGWYIRRYLTDWKEVVE